MRNNTISSNTFKITLGGMITALSVLFMFMTGIFPFATYALPGIAGALLIAAVIEMGKGWAITIYVAVSLLSLFIAPDKEAAVIYALILGHYAITKSFIEKIDKTWLRLGLKLIFFNVTAIASYLIVMHVFGITEEWPFGEWFVYVFLLLCNIVFIIYDIAMSRLVMFYLYKVQSIFRRIFRF